MQRPGTIAQYFHIDKNAGFAILNSDQAGKGEGKERRASKNTIESHSFDLVFLGLDFGLVFLGEVDLGTRRSVASSNSCCFAAAD